MPKPKNEQEYNALKEQFENYIDEVKNTILPQMAEMEKEGFTYNKMTFRNTIQVEAKGSRDNDREIDGSTPAKYLENLTNVMHEMLERTDVDKTDNLEWCMRQYQHQLSLIAGGLPPREMLNKDEKVFGRENPAFQALKSGIRNVPEFDEQMEAHKQGKLNDLAAREKESQRSFQLNMVRDPEFCEKAIRGAQQDLSDLAKINPADLDSRVQTAVDTVILGQRISTEWKNKEIFENKKLPESVKAMYQPVPVIRDNDMRSKENACMDYVNALLTSAHQKENFSVAMQRDPRKHALTARAVANAMNSKFGTAGLDPTTDAGKKMLNSIDHIGRKHNLKISAADLKALSGTGSKEFTELHDAYANYLRNRRTPGSDTSAQEDKIFETARDYLFAKKARPLTDDGKARVEAAAKLFTETALNKLAAKDDPGVRGALKMEMLRNPTCRKMVMEAAGKIPSRLNANLVNELKTFNSGIAPFCDKNGIALSGTLDSPEKAASMCAYGTDAGNALSMITGKPVEKLMTQPQAQAQGIQM